MGGEFGGGQEVVVAGPVVGAFMGEEGFALGGCQAAQHRGGDDDPVGPSGQRVRVRMWRIYDAQVARGGAAVGLRPCGAEGTGLQEGRAHEGPGAEGEHSGGRRCGGKDEVVRGGAQGVHELAEGGEGGELQQSRQDQRPESGDAGARQSQGRGGENPQRGVGGQTVEGSAGQHRREEGQDQR